MFQGFACRNLGETESWLSVDYQISCESDVYLAFEIMCSIGVLAVPIGIPGVSLLVLIKNSKGNENDKNKFIILKRARSTEHEQNMLPLLLVLDHPTKTAELTPPGKRARVSNNRPFYHTCSTRQVELATFSSVHTRGNATRSRHGSHGSGATPPRRGRKAPPH